MTCDEAADLIGPYNDDDLPAGAKANVEAHLLACRACAWDALTLQITRGRLRNDGTGDVVASDAFRARALSHLHADNPHLAPPPSEGSVDPAQYQLPIRV